MSITIEKSEYLTVKEISEVGNVSISTIHNNHKKWKLTAYKFGNVLIFKKNDIDNWIKKRLQPIE
jgi:excisionase family DNA binding protein